MTTPTLALPAPTPARRPLIAFPLVLIALGIVFLLANAGFVGEGALRRLVDLWPVALVLIGLDILVRDRSTAVAIIVEVAVIAASVAYAVAGPATGLVPVGTNTTSVGRFDATSLALTVNYGAGQLTMHSGTPALLSVSSSREDVRVQDVRQSDAAASVTISPSNDGFFFGTDRVWDVVIPSDIPVRLTASVGAGEFRFGLRDVKLAGATINGGASDLTISLPKPTGDVPVTISAGASSITLEIPPGVDYRVRTTGGLNSVNGVETSTGYAAATDRLTILVTSGASSITVR
ncbi:MAG: hypothetical protein AABM32_03370 [Chloroflexota bacterium]